MADIVLRNILGAKERRTGCRRRKAIRTPRPPDLERGFLSSLSNGKGVIRKASRKKGCTALKGTKQRRWALQQHFEGVRGKRLNFNRLLSMLGVTLLEGCSRRDACGNLGRGSDKVLAWSKREKMGETEKKRTRLSIISLPSGPELESKKRATTQREKRIVTEPDKFREKKGGKLRPAVVSGLRLQSRWTAENGIKDASKTPHSQEETGRKT